MRILRLCSVFQAPEECIRGRGIRFDPVGGMQVHTGELTRALDDRGHRQVIVTTRPPGAPARERLGDRTAVVRLGLPVPWFRQCYSVPASHAVMRLAAGADLLHAHLGEDLAVVPIALAAARRHSLPLVLTVHTSVGHTLTVSDLRSFVLKTIGGLAERAGIRTADAVITLTQRLASILTTSGVPTEQVHVIPSGVSPSVFDAEPSLADPLPTVPRPRILFVGRLHRQKAVDVLLRAFSVMRHADAHLIVAGDGPERPRLERLVRHLGVSDRVHLLGFVSHARVPGLMRATDVVALPSRYEELGTTLVEAMYARAPVVATATGGIPELISHGEHGLLVPPEDPVALAAALDELLSDPAAARQLAKQAHARATDLRWDRLVDDVLAVYAKAIQRRDARSRE